MGTSAWRGRSPSRGCCSRYCFVRAASAEVMVRPHETPVNRSWLENCPPGLSGLLHRASLAVGLVAGDRPRMWEVCRWAAVAMYFAYRRTALRERLEASIGAGDISTPWIRACPSSTATAGDALERCLERIVGCPRAQALGRSHPWAVPVLGQDRAPAGESTKPEANRSPDAGASWAVFPSGTRILQVQDPPDVGGVTLLCTTSRSERRGDTHSSAARAPASCRGRDDGCGSGILEGRSSTSRGDGAPCLASRARSSVVPGRGIDRPRNGSTVSTQTTSFSPGRRLERISPGKADLFQHEAPDPPRGRHYGGSCAVVSPVRGAGRRSARIGRIAGRHDGANDRQERLRQRRVPRPVDGLQRAVFVEAAGRGSRVKQRPAAPVRERSISTSTASRSSTTASAIRGRRAVTAVSGRSSLPAGRRRLSCWRRRVRHSSCTRSGDEQQPTPSAVPDPGGAERPLLDRGPGSFTSASIGIASVCPITSADRSCATPTSPCITPGAAAGGGMSCSDADMHARERDRLASRTTCGTPSAATRRVGTTSRSCPRI